MDSIHELSQTPENYAVHPDTDFKRNRKIGFKDFLLLLLTMEDDCLREELYRFFGRTEDAPTKAAFYHQRAKLKDDALWRLLQIFNQNFKPTLYKNKYRLVACDGSVADIFRDANDKDTYFEPNNKSPRGFNQIHVNALYSILDKQFLDVLVQPARKRNEYRAFCDKVDRVGNDYPTIYIADRGYASYNDFAHVLEKQQYFLIRCTDAKTSKLLGFPLDGVKELDYCDLKYPLCLNSFHSKKYTYIVQEVFARAIMYNFCAEISKQVEVPDQSRKLNYQINFSETIKICRDYLRNQTNDNVLNVEGLIADNIEPIRPNRTFRRQARFKLPMSFCYR